MNKAYTYELNLLGVLFRMILKSSPLREREIFFIMQSFLTKKMHNKIEYTSLPKQFMNLTLQKNQLELKKEMCIKQPLMDSLNYLKGIFKL